MKPFQFGRAVIVRVEESMEINLDLMVWRMFDESVALLLPAVHKLPGTHIFVDLFLELQRFRLTPRPLIQSY